MSDERDTRGPASVSVSDGNVSDTVRCPICEGLHPIKLDRRGNPYVTLSCMGAGSNLFPRTTYGKEKLREWKDAASGCASSVSIPLPVAGVSVSEASSASGHDTGPPSTDIKTALREFLEKRERKPS